MVIDMVVDVKYLIVVASAASWLSLQVQLEFELEG